MSKADCVRVTALSMVGEDYYLGEEGLGYVVGVEQTPDPNDVDCSGLPYSVFRKCGVLVDGKPFPRETADSYYRRSVPIARPSKVGDLGFLLRDDRCYHVFMFVGNDQVVEAGDGTGHVGLRTVAHESARGCRWGRLDTDIGELEDDMTAEQDKLLKRVRVSLVAQSNDFAILKAMIAGNAAEATRLEATKAREVAAEKARLGL